MTGRPPTGRFDAARAVVRWVWRWIACPALGWAAVWAAGRATGERLVIPAPPPPGPEHAAPVAYAPAEAAALADRVGAAWLRIEAQLAAKAPVALSRLRGPADPAALDALDDLLGRPLPPDVRASWRRHDGMAHPRMYGRRQFPHRPLGTFRPFTVAEMTTRAEWWSLRVNAGHRTRPEDPPAAPLSLAAHPRGPFGEALDLDDPDPDKAELFADLRTGTLRTFSEDGVRPAPPTPAGEAPRWVDHLEALADRLERLPPDAPEFADGGFDLHVSGTTK